MKKTIQKSICLLLTLTMMIPTFTITAFADETAAEVSSKAQESNNSDNLVISPDNLDVTSSSENDTAPILEENTATISGESVPAVPDEHTLKEVRKTRESAVFASKIQSTSSGEIQMATTYPVSDFSGNEYTVIECEPTGYYIFSNDTGVYVEYCLDADSPYKGMSGKLYYGGPTLYYSEDGDKLTHTIDSALSVGSDFVDALSEQSDDLHAELERKRDNAVLAFIEDKTVLDPNSMRSAIQSPRASFTYVTSYSYLQNLKTDSQIGYYSEGNGVCGYVAANMVLYYWQRRKPSTTFIPSSWYNSSGLASNSALTKNLVSIGKSLGYGTDSYPNTISAVLKRYCSDRGISATIGYWLTAVNMHSEINNDRPTILFGNLKNPNGGTINHAVVAYGHDANAGDFVVHFGWSNYSRVVLAVGDAFYGGNTYFRP